MTVVIESKKNGTLARYEDAWAPTKGEYVFLAESRIEIINVIHIFEENTVVVVVR